MIGIESSDAEWIRAIGVALIGIATILREIRLSGGLVASSQKILDLLQKILDLLQKIRNTLREIRDALLRIFLIIFSAIMLSYVFL